MAIAKQKTITLTVKVNTYSTQEAFKDAQTIVGKANEILPRGAKLEGVSVR